MNILKKVVFSSLKYVSNIVPMKLANLIISQNK
jgi:hypothetical protein